MENVIIMFFSFLSPFIIHMIDGFWPHAFKSHKHNRQYSQYILSFSWFYLDISITGNVKGQILKHGLLYIILFRRKVNAVGQQLLSFEYKAIIYFHKKQHCALTNCVTEMSCIKLNFQSEGVCYNANIFYST